MGFPETLALAAVVAAFVGIMAWVVVENVREKRRLDRRAADLCDVCGYDLRATPANCPECGTSVDSPLPKGIELPLDGVKLRDEWPDDAIDPKAPPLPETLVPVYLTLDFEIAHLLAEQFAARGVWCRVISDEVFPWTAEAAGIHTFQYGTPEHLQRTPRYCVKVPEADADRARLILDQFRLENHGDVSS